MKRTFQSDTKMFNMISKNKVKCMCGRSIDGMQFTTREDYIICSWCHNKLYKDPVKRQEQIDKYNKEKLDKIKRAKFKKMFYKTINKLI